MKKFIMTINSLFLILLCVNSMACYLVRINNDTVNPSRLFLTYRQCPGDLFRGDVEVTLAPVGHGGSQALLSVEEGRHLSIENDYGENIYNQRINEVTDLACNDEECTASM